MTAVAFETKPRHRPSVWLVTPAFGRYDLAAVVYAQWARLAQQHTIDLQVVVVSDDDNRDLAAAHGFHVVEQNNELLGRRYNDGFQYALEHGADFAADIGTKNLLHPTLLATIPWKPEVTYSSHLYSLATAQKIRTFWCDNVFGRGPMFLPRSLLEQWPRPVDEDAHELIMHTICARTNPTFEFVDVHDFQCVGIVREGDPYVTSVADYVNRWGVLRHHPLDQIPRYFAEYGEMALGLL